MSNIINTHLLSKQQIAKDTWLFTFEKKHTKHTAGQYTTMYLGNDNRDFTIASSPREEKTFSIITKKGISNFKKKLFSLRIGSALQMEQPAGGFVLPEDTKTAYVFLAGGIGMTPFLSMISFFHEKKYTMPLTLFVSFSKKEQMIFYDMLQKIQQENPFIRIIYTLSQDIWDKETGRISENLIKKYISDIHSVEYLIAGGEKMVEDTEKMLLDMGIEESKIRIDIFTGY